MPSKKPSSPQKSKKVTVKKPAAGKKPSSVKAAPAKKSAAPSKLKAVAKKIVAAVKKPVAKKPVPAKAPAKKPEPKKPEAAKAAPKKIEAAKPAPAKLAPAAKKPEPGKKPEPAPAPKKVEAAAPAPVKKPEPPKVIHIDFTTGDYVVYPTHGVGRIDAIETQNIAGMELKLIVIRFDKEKMTLRVPIEKAKASGLRKLSSRQQMDVALTTLKGRSRTSRAMWSRRAQEYEAKINSGDPVSIAEVLRDLHRNAGQPDQSYSERQIYEAALDRLARELAAVEKTDREAAMQRLEDMLKAA
ncbi:MAG: CarD family transcriptional regulator [Alphaproteobacteria bacterium]